jgi:hypothetical protein
MTFMKNISILTILFIALFSLNTAAQATATATATATIVSPIGIVKNLDMDFGNIATNGDLASVVMVAGGVRTASTGVTIPAGSSATAAKFTVSGESTYTYAISLPSSLTISTTGTTPNTMVVDTFTHDSTGTLTNGTEVFSVGATLKLGASQPAGQYTSGTGFDVTVNYN